MDEIIKIDTIDQYNKLYGLETMHPLVGIVDLKKQPIVRIISGSIWAFIRYS